MPDSARPDVVDERLLDELTGPERNAIAALQRLAKRWPRSLKLVSMDGALAVIRNGDPRYGASGGVERQECIIAHVDGIPNDGGAW